MAKRWILSPIVGTGVKGDPYRAKVADMLSGQWNIYSLIPSQANGTPRFNWALCAITSDSGFVAVDADAEVETLPGVSMDDTLGSFSAAVRNKIQDALTNRGVDLTGITLSSTIEDLLERVADRVDGRRDVLRQLWNLLL